MEEKFILNNSLDQLDESFSSQRTQNIINMLKKPVILPLQQNFLNKIYFTPQSRFIIIWQLINLFLIYLYFLQIPITIAFEYHRSQQQTQFVFEVLNMPAISIFILSILIKLKTAYYKQGLLIANQKDIIRNYFINSFILDFFSISSIIIYQIGQILASPNQAISYRFIVLLFYLKIYEIFYIERQIVNTFELNRRIKALLKLLLLLTKIFLVCNIAACGFFYLSDTLCSPKSGILCPTCCWIDNYKYQYPLRQLTWINQYIFSLYWASTTMISIGYGDIVPINPYQVIYTITMQFIAGLIFAYSLNQIWKIKILVYPQKVKLMLIWPIFTIQKNLRQKQIQKQIISQLTPSLRKQLFYQSYSFVFNGHKFFKQFTQQLLMEISTKITEIGYFQNQILFQPYDQNPICSLHYIQKGQMINYISSGSNQLILKNLVSQDIVGLYQFVTQINPLSIIRALRYSLVYTLSYSQWIQSLNRFQNDFQTFFLIKHLSSYQKIMIKLSLKCQFCGSVNHISQLCITQKIRQKQQTIINKWKAKAPRKYYHRFKVSSINCVYQKAQKPKQNKRKYSQQYSQAINYYSNVNIQQLQHKTPKIRGKKHPIKIQGYNLQLNKPKINRKNIKQNYQLLLEEQINSDQEQSVIKYGQMEVDKVQIYQIYFNKYNANTITENKQRKFRLTTQLKI